MPDAYERQAERFGLAGGELSAFTATVAHQSPYPRTNRTLPLRPTVRKEKPRAIFAAELVCLDNSDPDDPTPIGLLLAGQDGLQYTAINDTPQDGLGPLPVLSALPARGVLVCFWQGQDYAFHILLRKLAPSLCSAGWAIFPYASGAGIQALRLSRAGQELMLCDVRAMLGVGALTLDSFLDGLGFVNVNGLANVERLYWALLRVQDRLLDTFGVGLRATVGSLALAAAKRHLPAEPLWWRAPALLVSACRFGGAYRGGVVYHRPYRGPAWRVDLTRAYAWALSGGLPCGWAFGKGESDGQERRGIFLCRVKGHSDLPAYLASFDPDRAYFRKQNRRGFDTLAWLPQADYAGLRALGYVVTPLAGFIETSSLTVPGFIEQCFHLQAAFQRGHPLSVIGKHLPNAFYGKLAERAERTDLAYSITPPTPDWLPYMTEHNEVLPGLWCQPTCKVNNHQHVEAAATLTARVRSRVYSFASEWLARGGSIVHIDTDGLILTSDPQDTPLSLSDTPGRFRLDGHDPDAIIIGPKAYTFGGQVYTAGLSGISQAQLALVVSGEHIAVNRKVLVAPWLGRSQYQVRPWTLRAT